MIITRPKAFAVRPRLARSVDLPELGRAPDPQAVATPVFADRSTDAFFTPDPIAQEVARLAADRWQRVLEPSAGMGNIVAPLLDLETTVVAIDRYIPFVNMLRQRFGEGVDVREGDFLEMTTGDLGLFDAVAMNPPFAKGAARRHVEHALGFLKPGGVLVAIVPSTYNGPGETVRELPAGTFANTQATTKIILA